MVLPNSPSTLQPPQMPSTHQMEKKIVKTNSLGCERNPSSPSTKSRVEASRLKAHSIEKDTLGIHNHHSSGMSRLSTSHLHPTHTFERNCFEVSFTAKPRLGTSGGSQMHCLKADSLESRLSADSDVSDVIDDDDNDVFPDKVFSDGEPCHTFGSTPVFDRNEDIADSPPHNGIESVAGNEKHEIKAGRLRMMKRSGMYHGIIKRLRNANLSKISQTFKSARRVSKMQICAKYLKNENQRKRSC